MRIVRSATASLLATLIMACSATPAPAPAPAPNAPPADQDALTYWLLNSATAEKVEDAAKTQAWLSNKPGEVDELREVMTAAGVSTTDELEAVLDPAEDELEPLMSELRQRRPGSTSGDLAHWVGVSLLALVDAEPDKSLIPSTARWDPDYLADIDELRVIHARGNLGESIPNATETSTTPPDTLFWKPSRGTNRYLALANEDNWPIFAEPGGTTIAGVVQFTADENIRQSDYRVQLRRAGHARAKAQYARTVATYRVTDAGELEFAESLDLILGEDQTLSVIGADPPGSNRPRLWVWLGDQRVARVPQECCHPVENLDTLMWFRLFDETGDTGRWTMLPADKFRPLTDAEVRALWEAERSAAPPNPSYDRLGRIWGKTDRPEFAGARIMVYRAGKSDGEPLFVIHGEPGLGSQYLRIPLEDAIGDQRQLVFYDQRGAGYSGGADDPAGITMRRMVDDLERLRKRAEVDQIDVLAHGFGTLIALHYAEAYPDAARSLVLVDPAPVTAAHWAGYQRARASERLAEDHAQWFATDEHVRKNIDATSNLVIEDLGAWDLRPMLKQLSTPTLIVAGRSGVPEAAESIALELPAAELVLIEAGVYSYAQAPDEFAEAVRSFLSRDPP